MGLKMKGLIKKIGSSKHDQIVDKRALASQLGVTMFELILVVAVSMAVVIGGLVLYNKWKAEHRITDATQGVSQLASNIKSLYTADADYTGLTNQTAINANAVPSDLLWGEQQNQEIVTPWYTGAAGDQATITLAPYNNGRQFSIELTNIPKDACIKIGSSFLNKGEGLSEVLPGQAANPATTVADVTNDCGNQSPTNLTLVFE